MDLDLFDVFEEEGGGQDGKKPNARVSSHELVSEASQSMSKRARKDESHGNAGAGAGAGGGAGGEEDEHVEDAEILTKETTSTTESGVILRKISAIPTDYKPVEKKSATGMASEPAKVYPFKLDPFQQEAVGYIENDESVLVAAHTSAGKTAVAEYAIAKSLKNGQRVIYTSPIKALSNQKYRDMQEEFGDVGLMTGDMTINPTATCLIMTTEILRNMLYRGSEVMREVAWVIYDEVHYMRDKERGVVWEESIILLPHKVRFVFLSATIPNAKEFVGWVAKTHHQPCHVVYTDYRPVPLQHFVFPSGAEGLLLVVDEKGKFREDNFQKAMALLHTSGEGNEVAKKGGNRRKSGGGGKNNQATELFKIVRLIMERQLDPCIVFSFSKRDCETYATQMSRLDFNNSDEKELVDQVFNNAIEALSEDDKTLPQVQTLLPLLKRGIGIHHGGLLPILKEVIEILFQEGLIKCLFATETFSIGINMPAKTVVFTNTRKFDGKDFRWITSGEYIQMSGRAGRRGKDDRGIVIQMLDESMEPEVAKGMLYGDPDALYSSYHLGYNMVLNMLRVEDADPENILRASFHQYQQEQQSPEFEQQADELQRSAVAITIPEEGVIAEYYAWCKQLEKTQHEVMTITLNPKYCLPFFQMGRLVSVGSLLNAEHNWGWGIVAQCRKTGSKVSTMSDIVEDIIGADDANPAEYILDVLLEVRPLTSEEGKNSTLDNTYGIKGIRPVSSGTKVPGIKPVMIVVQVALHAITGISAVRLNIPKDLRKEQARANSHKAILEVKRRFSPKGSNDGSLIPLLDPVDDLGIVDDSFTELSKRCTEMRTRLADCAYHRLPEQMVRPNVDGSEDSEVSLTRSEWLLEYEKKIQLLEEARKFRQLSRESQAVTMRDELKKMRKVLRRSGFITADGVLETKGRFSCELSTADELVVTDMVFDGVFNELTTEQTVSLLSCFVHSEPSKEGAANVRPDLQKIYTQLQVVARKIAKVRIDAKIAVDEEEYVKSFNPELMEVCYAWCAGAKFSEVCRLTEVFEGSIIRVIRRLEELLRQLASASMAIGNTDLKAKFEEGADKIRRGVVFTASLYL